MSNYDFVPKRNRGQHLFIVEGSHEKNELLNLLLQCFPEMNIKYENIVIYGTNIYDLYARIVKEYGEDWADTDVDLPYVISKMKNLEEPFSQKKVMLPFKNGNAYKLKTKKSKIAQAVQFSEMLNDVLEKQYGIHDSKTRQECINQILSLKENDSLLDRIEEILRGKVDERLLKTAKDFVRDKVEKIGYSERSLTYIDFMRKEFCEIIYRNIKKANLIQNDDYDIPCHSMKETLHNLDFPFILNEQNNCSRNEKNGFIWVLNTSVLPIPNYSFDLIQ